MGRMQDMEREEDAHREEDAGHAGVSWSCKLPSSLS